MIVILILSQVSLALDLPSAAPSLDSSLPNTLRGSEGMNSYPLELVSYERQTTRALLHRYFSRTYDRPSFLVESRYDSEPTEDLDGRTAFHLTAVLTVVREMSR